eukprot:scaffold56905_cov59-Phaeocystis_antarctica.AAC.1
MHPAAAAPAYKGQPPVAARARRHAHVEHGLLGHVAVRARVRGEMPAQAREGRVLSRRTVVAAAVA